VEVVEGAVVLPLSGAVAGPSVVVVRVDSSALV
jgi:hypothetical protein